MLESLLAHPDVLAAKPKLPEAVHSALHAAVRAGLDPDRARRLAGLDRDGVTMVPTYDDPAWPAHLRGGLLEADKDLEGAVAAWQDALVERGRRRRLALTADVHQGLARCLAGLGQPDAARAHAETALGLLERWPGWRKLDAEALVRRFGGGRQQDGPGHLTPREREVACLLAEGLSNAEIGRRLFISTKTASVHVSNILAKLDMSSRAEIAAWAVREGLAG
jgi:DNA-binding CsgD family transcriptional regulator